MYRQMYVCETKENIVFGRRCANATHHLTTPSALGLGVESEGLKLWHNSNKVSSEIFYFAYFQKVIQNMSAAEVWGGKWVMRVVHK